MRPIVRGAPRARFSKFKESYHRPKSKDIEFFGFSLLVQVHKVLQAVLGENGLGLPSLAYTIFFGEWSVRRAEPGVGI